MAAASTTRPSWRAHGGTVPLVSFDQQLDKLSLWIETWNHAQRCELIEKLLLHMDYEQYRFLWTVMQPSLHRDFMYSAQLAHPETQFQPLSTHASRKLREKLKRNRRNNFYRVKSAYCEFPEEVLLKNTLPELTNLRQLSFDAQLKRKQRPNYSAAPLPRIKQSKSSLSLLGANESTSPLIRFTDQPVRRHIQNHTIVTEAPPSAQPLSLFKGLQVVPPNAIQVVDWYTKEWSDTQRNEFLHKLLLKLDERQHFFISNLLYVKQYKDFITLLPIHVSLKILAYLSPKQLIVASRVCRSWKRMCDRNEVWNAKCKEFKMDVSKFDVNPSELAKVNYKKLLRDHLSTLDNWETGKYREIELKGHTQNVLVVALEEKKARLASGSSDKTIKVWDIKTGQCIATLKGHTKGVWCLNFFTNTLLVSGSYDSTLRVWNIQTGKCVKTLLGHDGAVWSICRRGNTLLSGSQDRSIKVWDIRRCILEKSLMGHQAAVFCVDMDSLGEYAFSASADHTVRVWDINQGSCTKVCVYTQLSNCGVTKPSWYHCAEFDERFIFHKQIGTLSYSSVVLTGQESQIWSNIFLSMASIVILMQVRFLFNEIQKRLARHRNYMEVVRSMEARFSLATKEELEAFDDNCAICWDKMDTARKLPCGHLFHNSCLRSWLAQDTSCPTCRISLSDQKEDTTVPADHSETMTERLIPPPRHNQSNHFFHFDASRYVSWLPSFSVEVTHLSQSLRPSIDHYTLQLDAMANQVQNVFPGMDLASIMEDLQSTHSVDITINNILEGTLLIQPGNGGQPPDSDYYQSEDSLESEDSDLSRQNSGNSLEYMNAAHPQAENPIPADTTATNGMESQFSKSAEERQNILQQRKNDLLLRARQRYADGPSTST